MIIASNGRDDHRTPERGLHRHKHACQTAATEFALDGVAAGERRLELVTQVGRWQWGSGACRSNVSPGRPQLDTAIAHLTAALPDTSLAGIGTLGYLAIASARRGDTTRARAISDSLAGPVREWDNGATPFRRAGILAALGEKTEAVRLLRTAHEQGASKVGWHYNPALRALRGFSDFEALIKPQK